MLDSVLLVRIPGICSASQLGIFFWEKISSFISPANNTSSGVSESEYDTTRQRSNRKRHPVDEDRNSNNGVHLAQLRGGAYERQLEAIK